MAPVCTLLWRSPVGRSHCTLLIRTLPTLSIIFGFLFLFLVFVSILARSTSSFLCFWLFLVDPLPEKGTPLPHSHPLAQFPGFPIFPLGPSQWWHLRGGAHPVPFWAFFFGSSSQETHKTALHQKKRREIRIFRKRGKKSYCWASHPLAPARVCRPALFRVRSAAIASSSARQRAL